MASKGITMQQGAESSTIPVPPEPEVTPVRTMRNCKISEPQLSCGDASQQTEPKTYNLCDKAVPVRVCARNDEPGICSTEGNRLATFQIGEQCLTGIIPQKASTSEQRSPVRHKSATFPTDATGRSAVEGRNQPPVRPKSPDCVLPRVARTVSPTNTNKPLDTIDSLFSAPWGSTYDQGTSLWIPDSVITPPDRICTSEYKHTTKPKPLCVSTPGDVDHTCSAVCADDPACVTYHTMVDTITSEMPISNEKGYQSSPTNPVNHARPVPPSPVEASLPKVVANVNVPQHMKRPPYSVNSALHSAFKNGVTPIIFTTEGIRAQTRPECRTVDGGIGHRKCAHGREGGSIPLYVPRPSTVSALSTALPATTAVILAQTVHKYLPKNEEESDNGHVVTNGNQTSDMNDSVELENRSVCSLGTPQRDLNQTHSALSAVLIPSTAPILAESIETYSQDERSMTSFISVERAQSALRSLLLTTIVPVLGKEVDTMATTEPSNKINDTPNPESASVVTQQPDISPSVLTSLLVTTNVPDREEIPGTMATGNNVAVKPVVGSLMSLATRRHESSTRTALSSLLVTTTVVALGEAVEESCVELTEIELSDKVPDTATKVNNSRSILDIIFCRRR